MNHPSSEPVGFDAFALRPELRDTLRQLGYEAPTPIQGAAIPPLLEGRDLVGQAATGTGKTAAFSLPLLERLAVAQERRGGANGGTAPMALVLVPTRELAVQVTEAMGQYGRAIAARVVTVYGGQPIGRQLGALDRGADVVVATPGRARDHLRRGSLRLDALEVVVLDEADEMLDMGFAEDLEAILDETPEARQTVLFSATMPTRITGLARRFLRDPLHIELGRPETAPGEAPAVRQLVYVVARADKTAALCRVLDVEEPAAAIVFCRTRTDVDDLTARLAERGHRAEALHGGMGQEQRDRVMARVRTGAAQLLIATDVAARGLDLDQLTHVINFDVPSAAESYVHRIGRVGRAGRDGTAITLAEPRDQRQIETIGRIGRQQLEITEVPTVAQRDTSRRARTAEALRTMLDDGDVEQFHTLVDELFTQYDPTKVAMAALALAHERSFVAGAAGDDADVSDLSYRWTRTERAARPARTERFDRAGAVRTERPDRNHRPDRDARGRPGGAGPRGARPAASGPTPDGVTRLFVGAGLDIGMRPQDLVGAIAGETPLQGRDIGAITIGPRHSLVEVPSHAAELVIGALRSTTIKGKRANVRRERF